jgi:hypothetical protein
MKRIALLLVAILALTLGCKGSGPDIAGKWKGEVKMPATKADDPAAKMAEAFTQMFTGNLSLEFTSGDHFKLTMMGMPLEGKVARKGLNLTLTPETAMGMPIEEVKKTNPNFKEGDKLEATIAEDGSSITVKSKQLVFTRFKEEPKKEVASTVSSDEGSLVGHYGAQREGQKPANMTPKDEKDWKMAEAMLKSSSLELNKDNTFKMNLVFNLEGQWHVQSGKLTLHMTGMAGIKGDDKGSKDDMNFSVESGGRLVGEKSDGPGRSKLVFVKQ